MTINSIKKEISIGDVMVAKTKMTDTIQQAYAAIENAKSIGFYWTSTNQILDKIASELMETRTAINQQTTTQKKLHDHVSEEIGDLSLAILSLCYHLALDPETVLKNSVKKFNCRLKYVQDHMNKHGLDHFDIQSLDIALKLWQEAKESGAVEED